VVFVWTLDHQQAFDALKQALLHALVLALPDFSRPFVVETDASDSGIGAVLMQDQHPLATSAGLWDLVCGGYQHMRMRVSQYYSLWTVGGLISGNLPL
jgi:hypothetical protein